MPRVARGGEYVGDLATVENPGGHAEPGQGPGGVFGVPAGHRRVGAAADPVGDHDAPVEGVAFVTELAQELGVAGRRVGQRRVG